MFSAPAICAPFTPAPASPFPPVAQPPGAPAAQPFFVPPPEPDPGEAAQGVLLNILSQIKDFRGRKGRRHSQTALLSLLITALVCNCNTMCSVVRFGAGRAALRRLLGFRHAKSPSQSTYCRLFEKLKLDDVHKALARWLGELARQRIDANHRGAAVCVDGKAMAGEGRHVLHIFVQDYWLMLDMLEVGEKKNELSAFYEYAQEMLAKYPWMTIFTFDALYLQHTVAENLTKNGKRAIFQVKDNQKETHKAIQAFFAPLTSRAPDAESVERKSDHTVTRRLWVQNAPPEITARWPQARQIAALHISYQKRHPKAKVHADEWHYYLITGPAGQKRLPPRRILKLIRNHWGVENRLHYPLDRTFLEDDRHMRAEDGALIMGWLTRAAMTLISVFTPLRLRDAHMPEKREYFLAHPKRAVKMLNSCQ